MLRLVLQEAGGRRCQVGGRTRRQLRWVAMRSLIAFRSIVTVDPALLLRDIEVYELDRIDVAESYLVA